MFVLTNPRPERSLTSAKHIPELFKAPFKHKSPLLFDIDTTSPRGWGGMSISNRRALGFVLCPAGPEPRRDLEESIEEICEG